MSGEESKGEPLKAQVETVDARWQEFLAAHEVVAFNLRQSLTENESLRAEIAKRDEEITWFGKRCAWYQSESDRMKTALLQAAETFDRQASELDMDAQTAGFHGQTDGYRIYTEEAQVVRARAKRCRDAVGEGK